MPRVSLRASFPALNGQEQEDVLTQYLCDWPGCPNGAVHLLGPIVEVRQMAGFCEEHMPRHLRHGRKVP